MLCDLVSRAICCHQPPFPQCEAQVPLLPQRRSPLPVDRMYRLHQSSCYPPAVPQGRGHLPVHCLSSRTQDYCYARNKYSRTGRREWTRVAWVRLSEGPIRKLVGVQAVLQVQCRRLHWQAQRSPSHSRWETRPQLCRVAPTDRRQSIFWGGRARNLFAMLQRCAIPFAPPSLWPFGVQAKNRRGVLEAMVRRHQSR